MLKTKKIYLILFVACNTIATIYVSYAVNPYDKIKKKSEYYETQYLQADHDITNANQGVKIFSFTDKYTFNEYIYALICGAIAISAMVLPGISGSLVLILMGEYFAVVSAIAGLGTLNLDNMVFLGCFAIGIIFGGLIFARVVNFVLKRFYNATMSFLAGLMAGSLYALWPFKKSIVMAQQYIKLDGVVGIVNNAMIYTNINELPVIGEQLYISGLFFISGCIIMLFFIKKEIKG